LPGETSPVWILDAPATGLAQAGILRSDLFLSRSLLNALPPQQLAAALLHEHAHQTSHDNLKRLILLLAPGILPFCYGFTAIERAWSRFTEWAADDRAAAGDSHQSLSLAEALVRAARLGPGRKPPVLVTSLLENGCDLAARVDRLLHPSPRPESSRRGAALTVAGATLLVAAGLTAVIVQPVSLYSIHHILERLVH